MKQGLLICCALSLIFLLTACENQSPAAGQSPDPASAETEKMKPDAPSYTEEDAYAVFYADPDFENCAPTDCVLANDSANGLNAIIQYTDQNKNNACNLAFLCLDSCYPICFAVNSAEGVRDFEIADDSILSYLGNGTAALSVINTATNNNYDFSVQFSMIQSDRGTGTNFKITSEQSK